MGRAYARAGVLSYVRARHPGGSGRRASSRSQEQGWKENRPPAPYLPRPNTFDLYRCPTRQKVFHDRNHRGRSCGADIRHLGEKQASGLFGFCEGIKAVIPSRPLIVTGETSSWKQNAAMAGTRPKQTPCIESYAASHQTFMPCRCRAQSAAVQQEWGGSVLCPLPMSELPTRSESWECCKTKSQL